MAWYILFIIVAITDFFLVRITFKSATRHSRFLGFTFTFALLVDVFYLFSITVKDYQASSFFSSLYFLSIDFMLLNLLQFVAVFIKWDSKLMPIVGKVNLAIAALDTVSLMLNPFQEVALTYVPYQTMDTVVYHYHPYMLYNLHLAFCYIIILECVALLVYRTIKTPPMYMIRYLLIIACIGVIVVLNLLYLLGKRYFDLDVSILFYSISGMLIYFAVFKYSNKSINNRIRELLMESMPGPVALFDYDNILAYSNESMKELAMVLQLDVHNLDIKEFFESVNVKEPEEDDKKSDYYRLSFNCTLDNFEHTFNAQYILLRDKREKVIGKVMLMNDFTYAHDQVTGLDYMPVLDIFLEKQKDARTLPVQVIAFNQNGLRVVNETFGRSRGDMLIRAMVDVIRDSLTDIKCIVRRDDGTVIVALYGLSETEAASLAQQVKENASKVLVSGFILNLEYGIAELATDEDSIENVKNTAFESMYYKKLVNEHSAKNSLVNSLKRALIESGFETEENIMRTRRLADEFAAKLHISDYERSLLALLCVVHDIGKIAISNDMLESTDMDQDSEILKRQHVIKGYSIASTSSELKNVANLILHHHERWDGQGYPEMLSGYQIPKLSRIFYIVDRYDEMTHDTKEQKAISHYDARAYMLDGRGSEFDPDLIDVFVALLDKKEETYKNM